MRQFRFFLKMRAKIGVTKSHLRRMQKALFLEEEITISPSVVRYARAIPSSLFF